MEIVLSDEEYYDLFKSLHLAIERFPALEPRKSVLEAMKTLYKASPESECEFVITVREKAREA